MRSKPILVESSGSASQQFAIDPLAKSVSLSFHVDVTSTDWWSTASKDLLRIDVVDANTGAVLYRLGTWSNLDHGTTGTYELAVDFNLIWLRGNTVRLEISSTNDRYYPTTFRIDDVLLTSKR